MKALMLALAAVLLSACASNPSAPADLVRMVAIGQGTARFIEFKGTAGERSWRASEIIRIAGVLKAAAKGEDVSLDELQARALDLVQRAGLGLADQSLANTLIATVGDVLRERIATGVLGPKDRTRVALVLDQMSAAARPYVQEVAGLGPSVIDGEQALEALMVTGVLC
jgi:hypothetical protein